MVKLIPVALIICLMALSACESGPNSPRGFSLPKGDFERGELVFRNYNCLACHTMEGFESGNVKPELVTPVKLGGSVSRLKTYGELVTSVINPSHKLAKGYAPDAIQSQGESRMRNYNDVMTVSELIDLVTFLESRYELDVYEPTVYGGYP